MGSGVAGTATTTSSSTSTTTTTTTTMVVPTTTTTTPPTTTTSSTTTTTTTTLPATTTTTEPLDVERMARSILMVGIPGTTLDAATDEHLAAGGRSVILFGGNVADATTLRALTSDIACSAGQPVLVAVDQELSPLVRRLGPSLVTPLPTPATATGMSTTELREVGSRLGAELLDLGINLNLAPVLDVVQGPNPVLQGRSLGDDPELVAELGAALIEGIQEAGVAAVAKHFPGHGRSLTDPHTGVTVIDADGDTLADVDWIPFEAAVDAGALALMVGHPIYTELDPDLPASLSPAVLDLLRDDFGFDGVAITDSLTMAAVTTERTQGEVVVAALAAGEDLLLVPAPDAVGPSVAAIVAAVQSGDVPVRRLQEAVERVDALTSAVGAVSCDA